MKSKQENNSQKVYCGPSWLKHGLQKYSVYIGGFTYNVNDAIKECPEIKKLFCTPQELDSFRAKILTKGTQEFRNYEITAQKIKEAKRHGI